MTRIELFSLIAMVLVMVILFYMTFDALSGFRPVLEQVIKDLQDVPQ